MRPSNVACLLLAVAGISFGIGQSVGQADPQAARVIKVKDPETTKWVRRGFVEQLETNFGVKEANSSLDRIERNTHLVCLHVRNLAGLEGTSQRLCP